MDFPKGTPCEKETNDETKKSGGKNEREKRKQGKERQREVSCDNGDRHSFVDGTQ